MPLYLFYLKFYLVDTKHQEEIRNFSRENSACDEASNKNKPSFTHNSYSTSRVSRNLVFCPECDMMDKFLCALGILLFLVELDRSIKDTLSQCNLLVMHCFSTNPKAPARDFLSWERSEYCSGRQMVPSASARYLNYSKHESKHLLFQENN